MKRWIVIANCQAFGLAQSIQSLARDIDCDACDLWQYRERMSSDPEYYKRTYDFAVISDEAHLWFPCDGSLLPPHRSIPNLTFSAFHPDCCYVHVEGQPLMGVVGPYHSMIAVAAYKEHIPPGKAARFFNEDIFERAGYFDLWTAQRDRLVAQFVSCGIAIGPVLRRLSHSNCFMFTINHPKIELLFEVARSMLVAEKEPMFDDSWPPPETLAGAQWPIYPEVGRRLGLKGAYLFKPANENRPMELQAFLDLSHEVYAHWDKSQLVIDADIRPRLQRIRQMMREAA